MAEYKIVVTTANGNEYTLSDTFSSSPKAAEPVGFNGF